MTYRQLHEEVCKFSNVLRSSGAKKGDRICLYMPMVPELAIAVLACARIGAIHSVVFAGFSAQSLADRINDAKCNIVVTADGAFRGSKMIALKEIVDEGLKHCSTVDKVIVLERTKQSVSMQVGRDVWWHEQMLTASRIRPAEVMDSEDSLLFYIHQVQQESQRGSCTQLEGTWFMLSILSVMFFNMKRAMFIGVPPI